ncbi:MAG: glycyl-radical enzyme activating protein, partial [bacterium]
ENLRELGKRRANVIARIPIIPGITDSDKNLLELAIFLSSLKSIKEVNLLPYNRLGEKKYKRLNKLNKAEHLQVQSSQRMNELKSKFDSFRLNVKIGG